MEMKEQVWELINDDGFIYRRLKQPRLHSIIIPPPDPAIETKPPTETKKKFLLKLKTSYQQEILHWELLSNTFKALQKNQTSLAVLPELDYTVSVLQKSSSDSTMELADNLLAQVEAQEATICEIERICDVAEALCDAEEQRLMQRFIDLPIWELSPRELITSLLEE